MSRKAGGFTAATAAFGPFVVFADRALASQKTLSIAKWAHFLPEFDQWFQNVLAKDWGKENDTKVEKLDIPLGGAHGLLYAFDSLYVMVNEGVTVNGVRPQRGLHPLDSIVHGLGS